ncbi:MAG: hypothetical protein QM820_40780 [Minicystis sp.]
MLPLEELVDVLLALLVDVLLEELVDAPPVPATEPPVPLACIPPDPPCDPSVVDDVQPIEVQRSISITAVPTTNLPRIVH